MPHIKINFFLAFLMISTVSQPCISAAAPASGARHAHRQVIEKDNTLSMPCVFDAIDVGKLSILQQNIQAIFPDQQLLRQYLALCNQS
ncbi:MAG: hypothetical protein Q8K36_00095, partial [Alphaproteobacteria bacterium]|nr:hypothetical protein [Alphaproteobacteria bacterium]